MSNVPKRITFVSIVGVLILAFVLSLSAQEIAKKNIVCPKCGYINDVSNDFCNNCGASVKEAKFDRQEELWRNERPGKSFPLAGVREHQLRDSLNRAYLENRGHAYRIIDQTDPFGILTEKRMHLLERMERFMDRAADFHSERFPERNQRQSYTDSVQAAWVNHYASGLFPSRDMAAALAVDGSGNVYVTGYSSNLPFGVDYLTVKYSPTGDQVWTARYNGEGNGDGLATALAVDSSGNVYVTGWSVGSGTESDYATVKYNSAGAEQWVARYNGPADGWGDYASALAVDDLGNVYVTGTSWDSGTGADYATVKYNSAGAEQWVVRYNGPTDARDEAAALAVDDLGNVYVIGTSWDSGTRDDYATVKYNSDGVQQWVVRYNGPTDARDEAAALAVDGSGDVYVTGASGGDYTTVKYNSAGAEQWVARYNGPGNGWGEANALAVDSSGNVYVTGWSVGSGTESDYATVKYNSAGAEQWVARYNGPADTRDEAAALAVDGSGNVYVTGYSWNLDTGEDYATVKYNSNGVEQWVARYHGNRDWDEAQALVVDGSGNVYVTGVSVGLGTGADYATVKYNSAGAEQWVARYNGPGNSYDEAAALAVDGSGNVYVTGESEGSGTGADYATVKYNSTGVEHWVARYNGPGNSYDEATALAVDGSGNVYVTGASGGDYATVKYNSAGAEHWVARYNGPGNGWDGANALAIDDLGNVYVTGTSWGSGTDHDYATVKYNSDGVQKWVARYNDPADGLDYASALAVDYLGNVYVTGTSRGSGTNTDYATVKYNSDGTEQWAVRYNGQADGDDEVAALAVDASGNVYVTGASGDDYATVKYNSDGVQQWVARYNGPGNGWDEANALAVDASGNVYVTGECEGSGTGADYATVKYNSDGVQEWATLYDPEYSYDVATALGVDGAGNVYVTGRSGYSFFPIYDYDYATVKYNSDGVQQWVARYNGPGNGDDKVSAMAVDGAGNVYVTGESEGFRWSVYSTIKYVQTPVSVTEEEQRGPRRPRGYWLSQNYPNPFNPYTTLKYQIAEQCHATLKIYNILGQEVKILIDKQKSPGYYTVRWDGRNRNGVEVNSGIYFYQLQAGNFVQIKRMIFLK